LNKGEKMAGYVSSTSWFTGGNAHLRVYTGNGSQVTERCYDGEAWYTGAFSQHGTTVGSTSWLDQSGQIHIRVYVGSGSNGAITEWCWDKDKWYEGAFSPQTHASGDGASATSWLDNTRQIHLRVYVRGANGKVTEYCWDKDKWYVGGYTGAAVAA
jgi:Fungal fucose-specific lectin